MPIPKLRTVFISPPRDELVLPDFDFLNKSAQLLPYNSAETPPSVSVLGIVIDPSVFRTLLSVFAFSSNYGTSRYNLSLNRIQGPNVTLFWANSNN